MILYMLDTSVCVELARSRAPTVYHRLQGLEADEVAISIITLAELQYGVAKSSNPPRNEDLLAKFVGPLVVLPFGRQAADAYGQMRAGLARAGQPIGPLDMLIAAQALSVGATVVTGNEREFRRVPGLQVENWLAQ